MTAQPLILTMDDQCRRLYSWSSGIDTLICCGELDNEPQTSRAWDERIVRVRSLHCLYRATAWLHPAPREFAVAESALETIRKIGLRGLSPFLKASSELLVTIKPLKPVGLRDASSKAIVAPMLWPQTNSGSPG